MNWKWKTQWGRVTRVEKESRKTRKQENMKTRKHENKLNTLEVEQNTSGDLLLRYGLQMTADYREIDLESLKSGEVHVGAGEVKIEKVKKLSKFDTSLLTSESPLFNFVKNQSVNFYILEINQSTPHREMIPLEINLTGGAMAIVRIIVEAGIDATVVERISIEGQGIVLIEIESQKDSQLRYVAINQNHLDSSVIVGRVAQQSNNSTVHWFDGQMGGGLNQSTIISVLNEPSASATLHGIVMAHDSQKPDVWHQMIHRAPHTNSSMVVKSVAAEHANLIYRSLIHMLPEATQSSGKQKEDALLISPQATVQAAPDLKIENNEVKCSHGVTSGRLNEERMFYLLSRGFTEKEARQALVMAHVLPAINGIENQEVRNQIQNAVEQYIEQHL